MGGGKGGGGETCSTAGYAYFFDFAYAFATEIEKLLALKRNNQVVWSGELTGCGNSFSAQTGKCAPAHGSGTGKSTVYFFDGTQSHINQLDILNNFCPEKLLYKHISLLVFPGAFVGDNVAQIPIYTIKAYNSRFDGSWLKDAKHKAFNGDINPAVVIYHLMTYYGKIEPQHIDLDSFANVAETLYKEDLGISFYLSSQKNITDWIKEILTTIDGYIYYDPIQGKYFLGLMRDDYDPNELITIDESIAGIVEISQQTWDNVFTHFSLTYKDQRDGTDKTFTMENMASYQMLGQKRNKQITYNLVSRQSVIKSLASRNLAKYSRPFKQIKLEASVLDIGHLKVGQLFIFKNTKLDTEPTIFRITKTSGYSDRDLTYKIEAIEDLFAANKDVPNVEVTNYNGADSTFNFEITTKPDKMFIHDAGPEMTSGKGILIGANSKPTDDYCPELWAENNSGFGKVLPKLLHTTLNEDLDISAEYDRKIMIKVKDTYNALYTIAEKESNYTNLKFGIYCEDEQMAFGSLYHDDNDDDDIWTIKGLIRGLNNTKIVKHDKDTDLWIFPFELRKINPFPVEKDNGHYKVAYHNFTGSGPFIEDDYDYQYIPQQPYAPQVTTAEKTDDGYTLKWYPRMRLAGANYRSCDNIKGGEDEGYCIGQFRIKDNDDNETVIKAEQGKTLYTFDIDNKNGYKIRHEVGAYASEYVDLEIGI